MEPVPAHALNFSYQLPAATEEPDMEADDVPVLDPNPSLQPPAALEEPEHFPAPDQYPHNQLPAAPVNPHMAADPIQALDQQTIHQLRAASEEPHTVVPIPTLDQQTLHQLPATLGEPHMVAEPIPALDQPTLHQLPAANEEIVMEPTHQPPAALVEPHNAADVTLPGEDLNSLLVEATGPSLLPVAPEPRNKLPTYPIWIYKANFRAITNDERDGLNVLMLTRFLDMARKGEMVVEFRITSNYQDLSSGKLKIATENPYAIDAVKRLLEDLDDWRVLGPDDLSTTEGQAFWTFSPPVLQTFIQSNTLCELILAHTGGFLEPQDLRTFLPARKIKESNNCYLSYIFLTYKAQIYFQHFGWKVALIGSTLSLTPYGAPRGTTPSITKDPSPPDLINKLNSSHLG